MNYFTCSWKHRRSDSASCPNCSISWSPAYHCCYFSAEQTCSIFHSLFTRSLCPCHSFNWRLDEPFYLQRPFSLWQRRALIVPPLRAPCSTNFTTVPVEQPWAFCEWYWACYSWEPPCLYSKSSASNNTGWCSAPSCVSLSSAKIAEHNTCSWAPPQTWDCDSTSWIRKILVAGPCTALQGEPPIFSS